MSRKVSAGLLLLTIGVATTAVLAQSLPNGNLPARARYLPEYDAAGNLLLPKNFHEWVYVGSPLTPNALNGGTANFPEFHNVYIEPGSYEIYKETNVFPEGTILFKELQPTFRYCINSASLRFIHRDDMESESYGEYLDQVEEV